MSDASALKARGQLPAWLLGVSLVLAGCGEPARSARPQRVVLITLDTLRLDAFTGTSEQPSSMPRTRAWAEEGAVFQNYYSVSSSTQPAHATLFCGQQPWEHGVTANGMVLPAARVTLAERLRDAGWSTAAVVASGPLHASLGFDQGFEVYEHGFTLEAGAPDDASEEHAYARGLRSEAVGSTDVAATLLDLAGLEERGAGQSLVPPLDPARSVYGMRRTFAEPYEERRADNSLHALPEHLFFAFDGKRLLTGDAAGIRRGDSEQILREGARRTQLTRRFAQFQALLAELEVESITDEAALRALEQLGYAR